MIIARGQVRDLWESWLYWIADSYTCQASDVHRVRRDLARGVCLVLTCRVTC
jgi:hypothetical protein